MTTRILVVAAAFLSLAAVCRAEEAKKEDAKPAAAAPEKKEAAAVKKDGAAEAPEFLMFEKTKTMAPVKFPHKMHAEKNGGCAACHEGKEALFKQKKSEEGMKMADINGGKLCGTCHDGKKKVGDKVVFASKTSCMKCHKKAEPAKK